MGSGWVRRGAFVVAFAVASGGVARADRINVNWSGLYAGAQLGGAGSDIDWTYMNANFFNTIGPGLVGTGFSHDPQGLIGGFVGGYNYQTGPWLWGIEVTASAANMDQSRASPFFPVTDQYTSQINWLTSIAGRVGYGWDRWMLYAKGGWAGGEASVTLYDRFNGVRASEDQWANGWTIGGGADYRICPHISLGVGYDYADLDVDNKTITCPNCGPGLPTPSVDGDIKVQSVMARLTFHQ